MDIENIKYLLGRRVGGNNSLEEDCLLLISELQDRLTAAESELHIAKNLRNEIDLRNFVGDDFEKQNSIVLKQLDYFVSHHPMMIIRQIASVLKSTIAERDQLRAQIEAAKGQEPIYEIKLGGGWISVEKARWEIEADWYRRIVYAAPILPEQTT